MAEFDMHKVAMNKVSAWIRCILYVGKMHV